MRKHEFIQPDSGALHPQDSQHIKLTCVIHFYFDQKSPDTLLGLLRRYAAYSPMVLDQVHFVIVDDCSPLRFDIPDFNLNLTWLRITDDIPWNQSGARNLGVVYAKSDKILLCDVDFEFPEHTMLHMIKRRNPGKKFYKIYRKIDGKTPMNIFFISRARFMRFHGCDEEFRGEWGSEDVHFTKLMKYHGSWPRKLPKDYYLIDNANTNRDTAYHSLIRDDSRNKLIEHRKRSENSEWGGETGHSRIFLNFRWAVVKQHQRDKISVPRPIKRYWQRLWWFRTLFGSYD